MARAGVSRSRNKDAREPSTLLYYPLSRESGAGEPSSKANVIQIQELYKWGVNCEREKSARHAPSSPSFNEL